MSTRARLILAGMKSGYFCTRSENDALAPGEVDLGELEQPFQVADDIGLALSGFDLVEGVAGLGDIAGGQSGEEQRLADGGQFRRQLQGVLQIAHGGVGVAHTHADRGQPGLHADVVRRHRLGLLERLDGFLAAAGGGIGASEQIVGFGVGLAGFGDLGEGVDDLVGPALGELDPSQNLVGRQIVRRPAEVFARGFLGLLVLAKLFLDHRLQVVRPLDAADIAGDTLQVGVGRLVVTRLCVHHRDQIGGLDVAGGGLQHGIEIELGGIAFAGGQFEAGPVEARLHDAGAWSVISASSTAIAPGMSFFRRSSWALASSASVDFGWAAMARSIFCCAAFRSALATARRASASSGSTALGATCSASANDFWASSGRFRPTWRSRGRPGWRRRAAGPCRRA